MSERSRAGLVAVSCSAVLCLFAASPAVAQVTDRVPSPSHADPALTVTPFVSFGSAITPRTGAAFLFPVTEAIGIEAEFGADASTFGASANLITRLHRFGRLQPYVAAGIGIEQHDFDISIPTYGLIRYRSSGLAVNAGGGLVLPLTARIGLRVDARWINPAINRPEGWRLYQGVTVGVGRRE